MFKAVLAGDKSTFSATVAGATATPEEADDDADDGVVVRFSVAATTLTVGTSGGVVERETSEDGCGTLDR